MAKKDKAEKKKKRRRVIIPRPDDSADEDEIDNRAIEEKRKLFVGGLHPTTIENELREHLYTYGNVEECMIMRDPVTQKSRCFGFVTFHDAAVVAYILDENNLKLGNRTLQVQYAFKRKKDEFVEHLKHDTIFKVFVKGLDPNTTSDQFLGAFREFGEVHSYHLVRDKSTGLVARGLGFVTFIEKQSMDNVLSCPEVLVAGKVVQVRFSDEDLEKRRQTSGRHGPPQPQNTKIFVGGLPKDVTKEVFEDAFRRFGEIKHSNLVYDPKTKKFKGFGFIDFTNQKAVVDVLNARGSVTVRGKSVDIGLRKDSQVASIQPRPQPHPAYRAPPIPLPPVLPHVFANYPHPPPPPFPGGPPFRGGPPGFHGRLPPGPHGPPGFRGLPFPLPFPPGRGRGYGPVRAPRKPARVKPYPPSAPNLNGKAPSAPKAKAGNKG